MPLPVAGQVGPAIVSDGVTTQPFRQAKAGELNVSELRGRFYEDTYRGNLFSGGMTLTSISNATFTTLTATTTPIIGVWNPLTSKYNLSILQAVLGVTLTAATTTGAGPYVWAVSTNNGALTLGSIPWSRATLAQAGSLSGAKVFAGAALTGLTNNLVIVQASALTGGAVGNFSEVGTAVGFAPAASGTSVENIDGSFQVPPGGVLALLATTTPVGHSAASGILWADTPV